MWVKELDALLRIMETRLRTFHIKKEYVINEVLKWNLSFRESKSYMKTKKEEARSNMNNFCTCFEG